MKLTIKHSLLIPGFVAALTLAGCSTSNTGDSASVTEPKKKVAFAFKRPEFKFGNFGKSKLLNKDYASVVDAGYKIPAVPLKKMDKKYLRQRVNYVTKEKPGTIIVDVKKKFLYLVEKDGKAMRYGVGVGKAGFEWEGRAYVAWKQEWPKWTPPDEMIERKPELAKYSEENGSFPPGLDNPLGARALYLFQNGKDTLYRLHGTPQWWTIGTAASSGCIRLINQDIIDLYDRVKGRPRVIVKQ